MKKVRTVVYCARRWYLTFYRVDVPWCTNISSPNPPHESRLRISVLQEIPYITILKSSPGQDKFIIYRRLTSMSLYLASSFSECCSFPFNRAMSLSCISSLVSCTMPPDAILLSATATTTTSISSNEVRFCAESNKGKGRMACITKSGQCAYFRDAHFRESACFKFPLVTLWLCRHCRRLSGWMCGAISRLPVFRHEKCQTHCSSQSPMSGRVHRQANSGVLRSDGARGKKQVWHPHVWT